MKIKFKVYGDPIGWQRTGYNSYTKKYYTKSKTRDREAEIAKAYCAFAHGYRFRDDAVLKITVEAYYPIPLRTSKANRVLMLEDRIRPAVKPDCDNVLKLVCDALNDVAYNDDNRIVEMHVGKWYSDCPRTVITIEEIKE